MKVTKIERVLGALVIGITFACAAVIGITVLLGVKVWDFVTTVF